jgi:hypothetical protein
VIGGRAPLALVLTLAPLVVACGAPAGNGNPLPPPVLTGGGGTPGQPSPSGDVSVTIAAPAASPAPLFPSQSLIAVSAQVSVTNGTDFIDGTSVKATVIHQGGSTAVASSQLVLESGDLYSGRVSLGDIPSGTYSLVVTAKSSGGTLGQRSLDFEVDNGPILIVNSPVAHKSYKRSLVIEVVAQDPFGLTGPPVATLGALPPMTMTDAGLPDTYRWTVDFDAQMPPLFGDQLLAVAVTNVNGKRTEIQIVFTIDNDGPSITSTRPIPGDIAGRIVDISAVITDNAGVLDASVIAVIGDETGTPVFQLPLKSRGAGNYGALFDTDQLTICPTPPKPGPCIIYPTVSFRASDQLGNETTLGYGFALDNVPPVADLDSGDVRIIRRDGYCSRRFDPLALNRSIGDMPNDLAVVPQVFDLRARVQDDGNAPAGVKIIPIAGIDPDRTSVYILDDVAQPLVVDLDGDGTCDAINPKLIPTTEPPAMNNQVLKIRLAGVPHQGAPDYRMDNDPPDPAICGYPPVALPPSSLCSNGEPTMAIGYTTALLPAVWSVEPVNAAWCEGRQFDTLANHIGEGWACIAVQTTDLVGNTSVSAPLRVYIQYDGAGAGRAAPASLGTAPPCTGVYDKREDVVTPGECSTRRFPKQDYIYDASQ